jgi:hypothetical protein
MAETDFLSFLVDETLKLQKTGGIKLSSLELKLSDYKLEFLKGEYIPQTQVLRFRSSFGILDFPVNWSFFALEYSDRNDHMITANSDRDHLLEILQINWKKTIQQVLVTHADGFCYIVGLKEGEEYYLHDLLNPQQLLKAA